MSERTRRRPRQSRSRETVDVVLEAAAQVFDREGLSATTNRIAERAGVSIGSLYQYFSDKLALLDALAVRHVAEAGERLRPLFDRLRVQRPGFDETIRAIVEEIVALHGDRPALHALMHRMAGRRPADVTAMQDFEDWLAAEIAWHLERCGRGGPDAAATARMLVHAVDAHLHRVQLRHKPDAEELCRLADQLTS